MVRVIKAIGLVLILAILITICTGANYSEKQHEYSEIFANATERDYEALETVVYNEAGCCDDWTVRLAVVETVCNRVLDPEFPSTIYEVCHAKHQFACKPIKKIDEHQYEGVCDAIEMVYHEGRTVLPSTSYVYFATFKNIGKDYIYIGQNKKWQGMWFARK